MKDAHHSLRQLALGALCLATALMSTPDAQAMWSEETGVAFGNPETYVELFIVRDPGGAGPFAPPGASNFRGPFSVPVSSWSSTLVNPTYALLTGPAPADGEFYTFDMNFLGEVSVLTSVFGTSLRVDVLRYSGVPSPETLERVGFTEFLAGDFQISAVGDPGNLGISYTGNALLQFSYNRTPSAVPVPATLALMLIGLGGIGFQRYRI